MKVAVIPTIRDYPWGAPGHCMAELVRVLLAAHHEVLWFVAPIDLHHTEVAKLGSMGAIIERLPDPPPGFVKAAALRRGIHRLRRRSRTITDRLREFRPDHVFVNQGGTWCGMQNEFFGGLQPYRYSLICHLNQPQPAFSNEFRKRARSFIETTRYVYFNSSWTRDLAEIQLACHIRNVKFFQYPLRFRPQAPLPWPASAVPQIMMVNRLDTYHKGLDIAFSSFAVLRNEGQSFKIQLFGEGTDEGYLRQLAASLQLESVIEFCGYNPDISSVWARGELLLLPSRFEGLAVTMLEAMACGRPVARTPYGGAAEWMEDGVNGYLCPAAEVSLVCQTLRRALSERPCWQKMGISAYKKVARELSEDPARVFLESLHDI